MSKTMHACRWTLACYGIKLQKTAQTRKVCFVLFCCYLTIVNTVLCLFLPDTTMLVLNSLVLYKNTSTFSELNNSSVLKIQKINCKFSLYSYMVVVYEYINLLTLLYHLSFGQQQIYCLGH